LEGGFLRGADFSLECDLLVLDEVSMIDVPLMASVLQALPPHAALLIVGDVDQLPSVGPGQVLADLIGCGQLPVDVRQAQRQKLAGVSCTHGRRSSLLLHRARRRHDGYGPRGRDVETRG
jgi:ATP-dependent exoDNAse (exonuclease V) alpha subunit